MIITSLIYSQKKRKDFLIRLMHFSLLMFDEDLALLDWLKPNLGGLFRGLFRGGGGDYIACLKLIRIMLET